MDFDVSDANPSQWLLKSRCGAMNLGSDKLDDIVDLVQAEHGFQSVRHESLVTVIQIVEVMKLVQIYCRESGAASVKLMTDGFGADLVWHAGEEGGDHNK